jgi:hypothetical protein
MPNGLPNGGLIHYPGAGENIYPVEGGFNFYVEHITIAVMLTAGESKIRCQ